MVRIILIAQAFLFLTSCAYTSVSQRHAITLYNNQNEHMLGESKLSIICSPIERSWMISPIIPLPPIIPASSNDPNARLYSDFKTKAINAYKYVISDDSGSVLDQGYLTINKIIPFGFRLNVTCKDLDGKLITLTSKTSDKSADTVTQFKLKYSKGKLSFSLKYM
jgi:hypothetical protein